MTTIPDDIREKAEDIFEDEYFRPFRNDICKGIVAAALLAEREATVRKCVGIADIKISGNFDAYQMGFYHAREQIRLAILAAFPEVKP